ncbi:hypothetical protein KGF54_002183 [Candida jiufengensis]|uniref:uncharacterized protein n=1 Tax=Candida jiufengensis TaxID=497108 RepID=UPI0022253495|nr:uncharacterized protein KGF54_002183 [Candida jiufengensis]KAI5954408.1 hypothetical protein KGF54_002183 [Candida jiufengensis]
MRQRVQRSKTLPESPTTVKSPNDTTEITHVSDSEEEYSYLQPPPPTPQSSSTYQTNFNLGSDSQLNNASQLSNDNFHNIDFAANENELKSTQQYLQTQEFYSSHPLVKEEMIEISDDEYDSSSIRDGEVEEISNFEIKQPKSSSSCPTANQLLSGSSNETESLDKAEVLKNVILPDIKFNEDEIIDCSSQNGEIKTELGIKHEFDELIDQKFKITNEIKCKFELANGKSNLKATLLKIEEFDDNQFDSKNYLKDRVRVDNTIKVESELTDVVKPKKLVDLLTSGKYDKFGDLYDDLNKLEESREKNHRFRGKEAPEEKKDVHKELTKLENLPEVSTTKEFDLQKPPEKTTKKVNLHEIVESRPTSRTGSNKSLESTNSSKSKDSVFSRNKPVNNPPLDVIDNNSKVIDSELIAQSKNLQVFESVSITESTNEQPKSSPPKTSTSKISPPKDQENQTHLQPTLKRKRLQSKPLSEIVSNNKRSRVGLSKRVKIDHLHDNIKPRS